MPRSPRAYLPDVPQHVIVRGVNRQPVFCDAKDFLRFLDQLESATVSHRCAVHAYVLMTNHVHLLLTPGSDESIARVMQALGRKYVQWFNRRHARTGTLWEGRYRSCLVKDEFYLLACQRYIELNPVRAGMVEAPGDYGYSSYACNALGHDDSIITPHPIYSALHRDPLKRCENYRRLFADIIDDRMLERIKAAACEGRALGSVRDLTPVDYSSP